MTSTLVAEPATPTAAPEWTAGALLAALEGQFFKELAVEPYVLSNEQDNRAATILMTLLDQHVRAEEEKEGPQRKYSDLVAAVARGQKAAELLPKVRRHWSKDKHTFEFVKTRTILWEALLDGMVNEWWYKKAKEQFPTLASALLQSEPLLSDNESAALERVLKERFEKHKIGIGWILRHLLWFADTWSNRLVLHSAEHALIKYSQPADLYLLAKQLGKPLND